MIAELRKEYRFEAAHFLPRVLLTHKCRRMHGHSYKIELCARGPVDPTTGWVIDFAEFDDAWAELHVAFDHRCLNDVPGLENSTCENLAAHIFRVVRHRVPLLCAVTVWETSDASCTYRGDSPA